MICLSFTLSFFTVTPRLLFQLLLFLVPLPLPSFIGGNVTLARPIAARSRCAHNASPLCVARAILFLPASCRISYAVAAAAGTRQPRKPGRPLKRNPLSAILLSRFFFSYDSGHGPDSTSATESTG